MKKIVLAILVIVSLTAKGQDLRKYKGVFNVTDTNTVFNEFLTAGTIVFDTLSSSLWQLDSNCFATDSLAGVAKLKINESGGGGGDSTNIYNTDGTIDSNRVATITDSIRFASSTSSNHFVLKDLSTQVFTGFNASNPSGTEILRIGGKSLFEDEFKVVGSGTTSSTYSIIANDNSANTNFYVRDDGAVNTRLGYWMDGDRVVHQTGNAGNKNLWLGVDAGLSANSSSQRNLGIGYGSLRLLTSGNGNIGVGWYALSNVTNGAYNISLGVSTQTHASSSNGCVLIGYGTESTANRQFVTGSATTFYESYYFGRGVEQTLGNLGSDGVDFKATSVTGTNQDASGFDFKINASRGTGNGDGGHIIFKTAPAGSSGSSKNTLVDALTITDLPAVISNATFATEGSVLRNYRSVSLSSDTVNIDNDDHIIFYEITSTGDIMLQDPATMGGREIILISNDTDGGTETLNIRTSSGLINNAAVLTIGFAYGERTVITSDGTNWLGD